MMRALLLVDQFVAAALFHHPAHQSAMRRSLTVFGRGL